MGNGVISAARRYSARKAASYAHYCACGFVGFGNGAEWSHERKHNSGVITTPVRWVTREWWHANVPEDRRYGPSSVYSR